MCTLIKAKDENAHLIVLIIFLVLVVSIDLGRVEEVEEGVGLDSLGEELAGVGSLLLLLLDHLLGGVAALVPLDLVSDGLGDGGSVVVEGVLGVGLDLELVHLLENGVLEEGVLGEVEEERESLKTNNVSFVSLSAALMNKQRSASIHSNSRRARAGRRR